MDRARRGVVVVVQGWAGGVPAHGQAPPTAMLMMRLNGFDESYGAILVLPYDAGRLCTYASVVKPYTMSAAAEDGRRSRSCLSCIKAARLACTRARSISGQEERTGRPVKGPRGALTVCVI